ncbi:hypothetical protein SAMN05216429_10979 [Marinobacter persicus]|uniref:PilZ domain-containing protein n=1 Tax=Marinobacter persicus TaxID=930118 RepID=A0A1I3WBH4_9GAMM|nr:hypothetical protein [Marinobacter persicus]GHD47114.1 hypothetical protein GCM10008110_14600 [Marinobacter persicus]SFK03776.1 hypothetical protein SAMN05216429_10979 [Marinobacter persicus]
MYEQLPDIIARFRIRQGLFRKETVEAKLYELDGYGCVMKTDKIFEPGDTVVLDLIMDMPVDEISVEGLSGLVTEKQKHCSNFYYSIDFNKAGVPPTLGERLQRIVDVLAKKQTLRSRRNAEQTGNFKQFARYGTSAAAS